MHGLAAAALVACLALVLPLGQGRVLVRPLAPAAETDGPHAAAAAAPTLHPLSLSLSLSLVLLLLLLILLLLWPQTARIGDGEGLRG